MLKNLSYTFAVFLFFCFTLRFWENLNVNLNVSNKKGFSNYKDIRKNPVITEIVIVGAGLTGAVLANKLASIGKQVLVIEKRDHVAGNCYDYIDETTNILVNKYGAHLFHTNDHGVWNFIQDFDEWKRWDHQVLAKIEKTYIPVPVNINSVNSIFNQNIETSEEMMLFLNSTQVKYDFIVDSEQMALSRVGPLLYKTIFEPYTVKQWGKHPSMLDAEVTARIPVRNNFDNRYFTDKYQALPKHGYTQMISNMLKSKNIQVMLNTDFFDIQSKLIYEKLFFTGPIDRYFQGHGLPQLEYRSIIFDVKYFMNVGTGYVLPNSVVNYPSLEYPFTRAVEYKHFLHQHSEHSVIYYEYSTDIGEPYYPVPNSRNKKLYKQYLDISQQTNESNVTFVGRLANYKYFNMDQAIRNALNVFQTYQEETQKAIFIKNDSLLDLYKQATNFFDATNSFLESFSSHIKTMLLDQNCFAMRNHTVLFSMTDINYKNGFKNFKKQYSFHDIKCVIMIAFDLDSFYSLIDLKIPTIFFPSDSLRSTYHIGLSKAILSYCIVSLGFNVLFSEMDVFWSSSPLNYIDFQYDHFYSEHSYDPEINLGLYFSRSSNTSISFYKKICLWMFQFKDYDTRIGTADQKVFDFALRGTSQLIPETMNYEPQLWMRWKHALFWHNIQDNWKMETKSSRVTYHLSWGIGHAPERIAIAKQIGVWYDY